MGDEELVRLLALADDLAKWSPAPWSGDETGIYDDIDHKMMPIYTDAFGDLDSSDEEDIRRARVAAEFIAISRAVVPDLVAEVLLLRRVLEAARGDLAALPHGGPLPLAIDAYDRRPRR